jgi:hypothetical protein
VYLIFVKCTHIFAMRVMIFHELFRLQIYCFTDVNQHFILQVYLDVFSIVVIVLGGALACYGKHSILLMCMVCHYYVLYVSREF